MIHSAFLTRILPSLELGCRSGAYLLYGGMATVVWMLLVLSSFLSHCWATSSDKKLLARIAGRLSVLIRRLGKLLAFVNSIWIIVTCFFQFGGFFDRCYCNSSVLGRGASAFNVIHLLHDDVVALRGVWIGALCLAAGSAAIYVGFVNLFINPRLPD